MPSRVRVSLERACLLALLHPIHHWLGAALGGGALAPHGLHFTPSSLALVTCPPHSELVRLSQTAYKAERPCPISLTLTPKSYPLTVQASSSHIRGAMGPHSRHFLCFDCFPLRACLAGLPPRPPSSLPNSAFSVRPPLIPRSIFQSASPPPAFLMPLNLCFLFLLLLWHFLT